MSFCKRSVHSFLALSSIEINSTNCTNTRNFSQDSSQSQRHSRNIPSPVAVSCGGLTFFGDIPLPINVIESSTFKPPPLSFPAKVKRDPGGVGFPDGVGGSVDGLMSCTESLGFESSDERRVDDDKFENNINDGMKKAAVAARLRKVKKREVRKFPPPLSSLSDDGKPTFFLRSVRKEGRLELTEVKIHRPEILRASRQDGRLRLHLVHDETEDYDDVDNNNNPIVDGDEVVQEQDENAEDEVNEEERVEGWQFSASSGGGEGFRRCHEAVVGHRHRHRHHHHYNLHGWGALLDYQVKS